MECRTSVREEVEGSGGGNWGSDYSFISGGSYGNQDQSNDGSGYKGSRQDSRGGLWIGVMQVVTTTAVVAMNPKAMDVA